MAPAAATGPGRDPDAALPHVCYLCRRKFPGAEALAQHELLSDLHRQNLERQNEVVRQHKQEVLAAVLQLRQQLQALCANPAASADAHKQRAALEAQLRQLLGEFGLAQEMLEHSRALQSPASADLATGRRRQTYRQARAGSLALEAGVACWQGGKDFQEDRFILNLDLQSPEGETVAGFCVLDGHAGSRCVEYLTERFPGHLRARLAAKPALTDENLKRAVSEACALADGEFLGHARQHEFMDGSTMILALIYPAPRSHNRSPGACRLLVSNIGDSRAVLCRASGAASDDVGELSVLRLSDDHKPNRPDEEKRVKAKGGEVAFSGVWRVFLPCEVAFGGRAIPRWGLAVSRAFGDLILKEPERYGCSGSVKAGGLVIADPEHQVIDIDPSTDRFLVLACDGVWDILRDEDAVTVCAGQAGAELAAHSLIRHAFAAGSGDNLTALVVAWHLNVV